MPIVLKSGSLSFLEPSGSVQASNGIALPFTFNSNSSGLYLEHQGFHCVVRNSVTLFQLRVSQMVGLERANFANCEYIRIVRTLRCCILPECASLLNKLEKVNPIWKAIFNAFAALLPTDFQLLNDIV